MAQYHKLVVRKGLDTEIIALMEAELGFDTNTKTFRVGDGTATPLKIMTNKSTGSIDYSSMTEITLPNIKLKAGAKIAGVDISSMLTTPGLVTARTGGLFAPVQILSSDNSLVVTNGDGQAGNIDVKLHPTIIANILGSSVLTVVSHDTTLTGGGTAVSPLSVVNSSVSVRGIIQTATQTEANAGTDGVKALTPVLLKNIGGSTLTALQTLISGGVTVNTDSSLAGSGIGGNPLTVVQATVVQKGGSSLATQLEVNAGIDTQKIITPALLRNITPGSLTGNAITKIAHTYDNLQEITLPADGTTEISIPNSTFLSIHTLINLVAPLITDARVLFTTTVNLESFINGVWVVVAGFYQRQHSDPVSPVYVPNSSSYQEIRLASSVAGNTVIFTPSGLISAASFTGRYRAAVIKSGTGFVSGNPVSDTGASTIKIKHL